MKQEYRIDYLQSLNYEELTQLLVNYRNNYYQRQKLAQIDYSYKHHNDLVLYKQRLYMQSKYATTQEINHFNNLKSQFISLQEEKEKLSAPINKKPFIIATIIGTIITLGGFLIVALIIYLIWRFMQTSRTNKIQEINQKIMNIHNELIENANLLEQKVDNSYSDYQFDTLDTVSELIKESENKDGDGTNKLSTFNNKSSYVEWQEEFDKTIAKNDSKYKELKRLADLENEENKKISAQYESFDESFIQLPEEFANNIDFVNFAISKLKSHQALNWLQVISQYGAPVTPNL